ncbi:MAG: 4-hydroxy-tetrahydrodipicolinate synthase [Clostridia bacterium]|nr:4-hydroxy-tetrahydrodipicolinate synthase [Clostridia bacterium]
MSTIFKGSGVALVTPFLDGQVDYTALTRLIELQIASGTDAIIVCGTTGEAATMSLEERMDVIRFVVDRVNRRIPVIAGTGGNNTAAVIEASRTAEALGVDGLLIVTPFYNKTTQKGLVAHYGAICEQVHVPIIVYNVPSRTGLNVLPGTMRQILDNCENVVGIKEASGNIEQIVNLAALCPELDIYAGNDDHILPVLSVGGKGVISTIANVVPSEVHNLCMAFFAGKLDISRRLQFSLLPIWRAAFCETNPIPIKTMMQMMDLCSGELRLPLVPPTPENEEKMRQAMRDFGLIS